jgi:hypothetical protein
MIPASPRPHSSRCQVCNHQRRAEIDEDLVRGLSSSKVVAKYGNLTGIPTVLNHKHNHLPQDICASPDWKPIENAAHLLDVLQYLVESSFKILKEADKAGERYLSLKASDVVAARADMLARLLVVQWTSDRQRSLYPELDSQSLVTLASVDAEIERLKSQIESENGVIEIEAVETD